jgi:hypothetical protein
MQHQINLYETYLADEVIKELQGLDLWRVRLEAR